MQIPSHIVQDAPARTTQKRFLDITRAINGGIEYGSPSQGPINIRGSWTSLVTPGVTDTEFTITHNLGYVPTGIHTISIDQAAIIYASRKSAWTTTEAFFKCNTASVNLQGFIL